MKRKLTILGVVGVLAVFSLASVAAASAHGFGGSSERIDRVAELLGVSPEELSEAVETARSEARAERLEERLTTAVEDGVITTAEADAIRDWFNGKPDALSNLSRSDRHGLKHAQNDGELDSFLAGLVADEVLTQAESDEIATWLDARPSEALETLRSEYGKFRHHGRSGGHHGRGGFRGFRGFEPPAATPETSDTGVATSVQYY